MAKWRQANAAAAFEAKMTLSADGPTIASATLVDRATNKSETLRSVFSRQLLQFLMRHPSYALLAHGERAPTTPPPPQSPTKVAPAVAPPAPSSPIKRTRTNSEQQSSAQTTVTTSADQQQQRRRSSNARHNSVSGGGGGGVAEVKSGEATEREMRDKAREQLRAAFDARSRLAVSDATLDKLPELREGETLATDIER